MEKEILLSELKGKYTKDFDTFGKMDPFIVATVGKSEGKTEVASGTLSSMQIKEKIVLGRAK